MVANPLTAADLRRIADDMADGDVVLADIWDRKNACEHIMPNMTTEQWQRFCTYFSNESPGLSGDLQEYMEAFAKGEGGTDG